MQRTERSTSVERKKFPVDFPDAFLSVCAALWRFLHLFEEFKNDPLPI